MKLYIQQIPRSERMILAGDHTSWSRPFAKTLKERTYEHSPSQLGGSPVTVGSGGDKRPRTFTGKAFCTIGPPQKFRLSDKIISRVKSADVVIKKKGLANTTRPQSII